jgi:hypothetical protein
MRRVSIVAIAVICKKAFEGSEGLFHPGFQLREKDTESNNGVTLDSYEEKD